MEFEMALHTSKRMRQNMEQESMNTAWQRVGVSVKRVGSSLEPVVGYFQGPWQNELLNGFPLTKARDNPVNATFAGGNAPKKGSAQAKPWRHGP